MFVGDTSKGVRENAIKSLTEKKFVPTVNEIKTLSDYLTRTAAELRAGVIEILMNSTDSRVLTAADTLLTSKNKNQRLAGLELLRELSESGRGTQQCQTLAASYKKQRKTITKMEQVQLQAVLDSKDDELSFDNCLGLIDPAGLSPVTAPEKHKVKAITPAAINLVKSLDEFVHLHRDLEVSYSTRYDNEIQTHLLAETRLGFPLALGKDAEKSKKEISALLDLLCDWYRSLDKKNTDSDNFHLLRAANWISEIGDRELDRLQQFGKKSTAHQELVDYLIGKKAPPKLRYRNVVNTLLDWCLYLNPSENADRFSLQVAETGYAMVPESEIDALCNPLDDTDSQNSSPDFRGLLGLSLWRWTREAFGYGQNCSNKKRLETRHRAWQLLCWQDRPVPNASRNRSGDVYFAAAYQHGWVNEADIYDQLIGPRTRNDKFAFSDLTELTEREPRNDDLKEYVTTSEIAKIIQTVINRLFEIEIARGESDTLSTNAMMSVKHFTGMDKLIRLLAGLDKAGFVLQGGPDNRAATFTHLIGRVYPSDTDTPAAFSKAVKASFKSGQFTQERLLQLAFYAPQWRDHVAHVLGWNGFIEAMYWFMAHMKYVSGLDDALTSDEEIKQKNKKDETKKLSRWGKMVRERTPFTAQERLDGAIDVSWFRAAYDQVSAKRWIEIANAAKYASSAPQAKRAQMVADVLLGKYSKKALLEGITKRHLKENVRLLGLMPLAKGTAQQRDLKNRYEALQDYKKYASNLSSMSRPEAMRSVEIGFQNLASTAGYPDPFRLQWALEAEATKDLADGPVSVKQADITVTLTLDDQALPVLTIHRDDKKLKALPRTAAKDKKISALVERHKLAKQQAVRIKHSLEELMCRCDQITGSELNQLADHALLWPQLQRLVLVSERGLGFPCRKGKALRDHGGSVTTVRKDDALRISHPYDLLKNKDWPKWQRYCFDKKIHQPFKQVFRELYPITPQEKKDKDHSNRYAGYQVNRNQAFALWGTRGWSLDESDNIWKVIYHEEINVEVEIDHGYDTPLRVEGLTLDKIRFVKHGTYKSSKLTDVSAVLFSEVMRDIDLVVSVAHVGEVDPEASASTIEMRTTLLKETCQLLKIKNVSFKTDRAIIKGELAEYSIHLGSGVVHKLPGGAVCLVPVHSQHRGRLFLPFADDDPRTAEVISKCLTLARDKEIDDPGLIRQILR